MSLRVDFVIRSFQERIPFVELCAEFGISPKTGYKWRNRFLREGPSGLIDRSRRPDRSPSQLSEGVICDIVCLKKAHMNWGYRKIRELYARKNVGRDLPSESSFKRVLERTGFVEKRRRRSSKTCGRIQNRVDASKPNDVWTVDFKGWWYTPDGDRCEPLTVRDAFSRYVLCASVPPNARTATVRSEFERLFERYGLPGTIRSDNGSPFAASTSPLGLSRLSAWWSVLGIDLDRIDPGRPYQNGAHERMHLDIAREIEGRVDQDLSGQAAALEVWRQTYNKERPHEALNMKCPAELYERSHLSFEGTPDRLVYPPDLMERRVHKTGRIRLDTASILISTALSGWNLGLKSMDQDTYSVYFGRLFLGTIDQETDSFQTCPWRGTNVTNRPAHA